MSEPPNRILESTKVAVARGALVDLALVLLLFAGAGIWGANFRHAWTERYGPGVFYQTYFEPAVMVACGKGFVISQTQPKPLEDFLFQRRDSFNCADLPPDETLGTRYLYQGAWRYLLVAVGLAWRVTGISWSGMGPIFGVGFGAVVALAYGIFRLGMGRVPAGGASIALATSSMHLVNLPHLRDYAKAPFTLALVLLLGVLVARPVRQSAVLALAAACGLVLGVGYGFRTDFLVNLPVPIITIVAFIEGGVFGHLRLKAMAVALFLATFFIASWPVTSAVYSSGGCQWHVSLLGLQSPLDRDLGVQPAPYEFGYAYSDSYIDRIVNGYRWRQQPGAPELVYCSHEYDVQSGQYLAALVRTFPADFIARSYASILQVVELPFQHPLPPLEGWFSRLYSARLWILEQWHGWGFRFAVLAVVLTAAGSLRVAAFLVFFLAYFGGYPAIQFQERHYFHLEFMGWWALGLVAQRAVSSAQTAWRGSWPEPTLIVRGLARAAALGAVAITLLVGGLAVARWYQARQVRQMLSSYVAAPKSIVDTPEEPLREVEPTDWPQLLEVDVDGEKCGDISTVTVRYDGTDRERDFTHTVAIRQTSEMPGVTRLFVPVFEAYAGLDLAKTEPGCVTSVRRVTDVRPLPLILGASLPPGWESMPLYQRLENW